MIAKSKKCPKCKHVSFTFHGLGRWLENNVKRNTDPLFHFEKCQHSKAVSTAALGWHELPQTRLLAASNQIITILYFVLYRAGKTSQDQCHCIIQYLLCYKKWRNFLLQNLYISELICSLFLHFSHFTLMNILISLVTLEVVTCALVRFTVFLSS